MKRRTKKRIVKWVLPFAIPETVCLILFIYGFACNNATYCEVAGVFAMTYIWVYTIVCAVLLPDDFLERKKNSNENDSTKNDNHAKTDKE